LSIPLVDNHLFIDAKDGCRYHSSTTIHKILPLTFIILINHNIRFIVGHSSSIQRGSQLTGSNLNIYLIIKRFTANRF
jgi:hypothetical protein